MATYGTFEAKNKLSELLDKVESGEDVVITRHGKAVARLVSVGAELTEEQKKRARKAMDEIRAMRKLVKPLGDLTVKDLINEGRRY
jgi:prevent-host-death family protein